MPHEIVVRVARDELIGAVAALAEYRPPLPGIGSALEGWAAHRGSGIVVSEGAAVREGETVALAAPMPVGVALAVCRIIEVVDEQDRYGFAYGTLPLHPEEGEEAFLIERDREAEVRFRIVAFSKPSFWAGCMARPANSDAAAPREVRARLDDAEVAASGDLVRRPPGRRRISTTANDRLCR